MIPAAPEQRAQSYRLLASAFLEPPTPERIAQLRGSALTSQVGGVAAQLDELGQVRQEFMDLFKVPTDRYVPPFEAVHRDSRLIEGVPTRGLLMGPSTVDVRRLYRNAGAELRIAELPDHIGVELAFLAFLCHEEQAARAAGNQAACDNYRQYQRGFLADHVLQWVPDYCQVVHQRSATSHFRTLTAITPDLCRLDHAALDALTRDAGARS
jgi:putative dimethyl sulfoxide reductase chaperone